MNRKMYGAIPRNELTSQGASGEQLVKIALIFCVSGTIPFSLKNMTKGKYILKFPLQLQFHKV